MKPVWTGLGFASLAWSTIACEQLFGIPGGEFRVDDAGSVATLVVRGTAIGVLEPLNLRLDHLGRNEILSVTSDGPFEFMTRLTTGVEYAVVPLDDAPCVVANGAGMVAATDVEVELACESVLLSGLAISGPAAPDLGFDQARRDYNVDVSLLQQEVLVTATAASPDASIEIQDNAVVSGVQSGPFPLALGDNEIEIKVRHRSGAERTYGLTLSRAPDVAQRAYGKPSNTGAGDAFGASVALWGDTLAVGAPGEASSATGVDGQQGDDEDFLKSGAVYVFRRTDGVWQQEAYLKASNTSGYSEFGNSVALWNDTLAVGAWGESSPLPGGDIPATSSGAVYVFRRDDSTWTEEAFLKGFNTETGDEFGFSVALWEDTLAVGAPQEDSSARGIEGDPTNNAAPDSGAVYVFRRTGAAWLQEAYIKASNSEEGDKFGIGVALWNGILAAGAFQEDSGATGVGGNEYDEQKPDSGAAYVFSRSGSTWTQKAYLKASNTDAEDHFGYRLALWGDTLAVGAPEEDSSATGVNEDQHNQGKNNSGAVYVFRNEGVWKQEAYIKSSNSELEGKFGDSLAVCGDTLAAGTFREDNRSGAAYVFQRVDGVWSQQTPVKASNAGDGDWFAFQLALSEDTLAIGAIHEDSNATGVNGDGGNDGALESGAVYVFH